MAKIKDNEEEFDVDDLLFDEDDSEFCFKDEEIKKEVAAEARRQTEKLYRAAGVYTWTADRGKKKEKQQSSTSGKNIFRIVK